MANDIRKINELSDEQLIEIDEGGYDAVASKDIISKPLYGISVKNPNIITAKYGVALLYSIKPPNIKK